MSSEKQMEANRQNAQLSTGPVTVEGKAIVAHNAVKHGIFAKDLIITGGDGKEEEKEYFELLNNLIECLNPSGQMEHLLVEKIAVDFWRLKRLLRFEMGCIRQYVDNIIDQYYKPDWMGRKTHKTSEELDGEIDEQKGYIDWNKSYMKALKKGEVDFNKPVWANEEIESNILDDLITLVNALKEKILDKEEYARFKETEYSFEELRAIFRNAGYTDKDIAEELIECLENQNKKYQKQIEDIEKEKQKNRYAEQVEIKAGSLPIGENADKIIKYERALQRSIFQNLALIKRLQFPK